jgi:two-component system, cell cycle response regulator
VLDGSTSFFNNREANGLIQQIIKDTKVHDGTLLKVNASQETCYQDYPFNSIVSVKVETTGLQGVAIMLHRNPFKFKYDDRTLVENVMEPTKLALRNTMLQEKLEQLVATDHLTDLYSRAYLEEQICKSMQEDSQGTLILLDIDDFKKINDTYGHQIGDNVLVQVSNIIKDVVRSTDIAARWGGEELAAYLPKIGIEHGKKVASRIIEEVEKISNPRVTTSCGVSAWGGGNYNSTSIDKLFKSADDALYIAKNTGKNKVTIAN